MELPEMSDTGMLFFATFIGTGVSMFFRCTLWLIFGI